MGPETMSGTHPVHLVEGTIEGEGPWTVGSHEIRIMEDGDRLANEHNSWSQYRRGPDGKKNATRTKAWASVRGVFPDAENLT